MKNKKISDSEFEDSMVRLLKKLFCVCIIANVFLMLAVLWKGLNS